MNILQMFSYPFMQRALIAGVLVSLCAALLGVPLVLKRYSMIGDGLSHVSFGALAIAVALGVMPLYFSIPVVILAAFFLLRMASHPHWNSDAAIAAVSASALAIGILVISRTTGMTTDVDNYMFGSVLAMTGTVRAFLDEHPDKFDPREYLKPARANIKELVRHKLRDVLGCAGKA